MSASAPVDDGYARHGNWRPDDTGERCLTCGRTWGGHAGTGCFAPDARGLEDARFDLLVRSQLTIEDVDA